MGLGFSPLAAAGLSLIANTAPVAFGALGTPSAGLAVATGFDPYVLGAMVGRQLPFFSVLVPFWLIWAFAGWRGMMQIWPAILVCGVSFAAPQFLISNDINPWIVDIGASIISMACMLILLRFWQPAEIWTSPRLRSKDNSASTVPPPKKVPIEKDRKKITRAWIPWAILCAVIGVWGTDQFKGFASTIFSPSFPISGLHNLVQRPPPWCAKR